MNENAVIEKNALYELGLAAMCQEQVPIGLHDIFADGLYGRIVTMPAHPNGDTTKNTLVMTAIHKHENITIVLSGKCIVMKEDGTEETIEAPTYFVTPARTQRAVLVLETSTWMTVHACNAKTRQEAENYLAEMPDFYNDFKELLQ
jgi:hypothetical protein